MTPRRIDVAGWAAVVRLRKATNRYVRELTGAIPDVARLARTDERAAYLADALIEATDVPPQHGQRDAPRGGPARDRAAAGAVHRRVDGSSAACRLARRRLRRWTYSTTSSTSSGVRSSNRLRTRLVIDDVLAAVRSNRSPLVLTERTEHLDTMAGMLREIVRHVIVVRGGTNAKERRQLSEQLQRIGDQEPRVLLATGRYIGEGFDDARLDTLFLALPVSWRGTIRQYAGRLHRLHARKRIVQVFDYVDAHVPVLARMYERRLKGYRDIGYAVSGMDH